MTATDPNDIEKILGSLSPKAVPPGLRAKVLGPAMKMRQDLAMKPWMWAAAVACAALIAVAVLGDMAVARAQNDNLRALLNGRAAARPLVEDPGLLLAEISGETSDVGKAELKRIALARPATRSVSLQDVFAARDRLKGWLDHESETPESPY
jgi:hypothetical protein